ncbi:UDP-N-acetylglucosamine 2-epimerase (non-hydrolyzing) [Bacillus lacus]|uniref:UDP-N-acetylglucosamine 2-epimerase (Non-hydrolyzing) n=1 Tax=Metabacillus lacus TaxID=1983721 RepID=A0A7X2LZW8_9BACI|nr:UDP-N-acetylglucosamine 2-epimerase (non-hydrolyzing) [Metabacillus lacus]MRX72169.1 UDP-N-acetylglucosamine 2-epimerase (non-hydrolyzing) [Metabacillus lacus]
MKKIVTIIGARPQFIKAAPVSREIRKHFTEIIVHTGQHYDKNMSDIFFEELQIPKPDYSLNVGSSSHGKQTGEMLIQIEEVLLKEEPDYVLVYGDTNSTLAGSLAASKLHIPVVHIEAGLRSFNKKMPEEINRIMTDHVSQYLFCPTQTAVDNLKDENITQGVHNVGDVMYDAVLYNLQLAEKSSVLENHGLEKNSYHLITLHRAENTDDQKRMENIISAFQQIDKTLIWPIHPRTKNKLEGYGIRLDEISNLKVIEPVGYLDMLTLVSNAEKILTDSGGVQKEAYFLKIPCVTLREETEWVETVQNKGNVLVGSDTEKILAAANSSYVSEYQPAFGDGESAKHIAELLKR